MLSVSTLMLYDLSMNAQIEKPYHHGDLHEEILCAACRLLEENNIASLSLREIAKEVGVSHTAPYRHFKDKESLLAGIAGLGFDRLTEQLTAAVTSNPGDPVKQLIEAGQKYVSMAQQRPQCTQLMFGGILPCDDTYPELRASGDSAFEGLLSIIIEGQALGVFKPGDIKMMALTAWSGIHGLSMLIIGGNLEEILKIPVEPCAITNAVINGMLEGLKAH